MSAISSSPTTEPPCATESDPPIDPRDWVGSEMLVPVADGRLLRYVNLDHAATTPPLRLVRDTVERFLDWYSSVHRGAGFKSRLSTDVYEQSREVVADFLGADPARDRVLFTKSATESLNMVANALDLQPDDVVIASAMEHHSDILPWQRRCRVDWIETDHHGRLDLGSLEAALRRGADRVRLVALTGASNVTGYRIRIHEAAAIAHRYGALISIDAAQLVAHHAISMRPHGDPEHLDFVSFSGHKMYAPYGAGVLAGPAQVLDAAEPLLAGGGTVSIVERRSHRLVDDADRHEAGSPNVVGAVAIATAIAGLRRLGLERIARHERARTRELLLGLGRLPRVRVLGDPDPDGADRGSVVSFVVDGVDPDQVTGTLSAEWAVAGRDGAFCAHPYVASLLAAAGADDPGRTQSGERCDAPGAVRLSVGPATRPEDIQRALDGMAAIVRGHVGRAPWMPDYRAAFQLPI